jgi:hypothetical protein
LAAARIWSSGRRPDPLGHRRRGALANIHPDELDSVIMAASRDTSIARRSITREQQISLSGHTHRNGPDVVKRNDETDNPSRRATRTSLAIGVSGMMRVKSEAGRPRGFRGARLERNDALSDGWRANTGIHEAAPNDSYEQRYPRNGDVRATRVGRLTRKTLREGFRAPHAATASRRRQSHAP